MNGDPNFDNRKLIAVALGGTAFLGLVAVGLSLLFSTPLAPQFYWSFPDALIGLVATLPMLAFLFWFMRTRNQRFASFRESQIEFFANIGFAFTPTRMVLMALFAGVFEELLFRGAIQTTLDRFTPAVIAILFSAIMFGVVHWRTWLYALIAGMIGLWLGVVFWLTGNLLAPMIAHGVYDLFAFIVTAQEIRKFKATLP